MRRSPLESVLSYTVLLPFVAVAWFLYSEKGVAYDTFVFGSGSWGIGCILKIAIYRWGVSKLRHDPSHLLGTAALNGLSSGVTELGAALVIFRFMPALSLWDIVGFGVGIGTVEAFVTGTTSSSHLLKGTRLEGAAAELEREVDELPEGQRISYSYVVPILERLIAGAIHIGTRGLAYVAYISGNPIPFLVALSAFVLVDGIIGYRWHYEGRLSELGFLNKTYAFLAVIGGAVLASFLFYWPDG